MNCVRVAHMVTNPKAIPMAVMKGRMVPSPLLPDAGFRRSGDIIWMLVASREP
jgi:hypothetical protein